MATHLTTQNRRQTVQLIHQHQVLEGPWLEEERISFLKGHGRRELGLLVVVAQVSYLVQVAETESKSTLSTKHGLLQVRHSQILCSEVEEILPCPTQPLKLSLRDRFLGDKATLQGDLMAAE